MALDTSRCSYIRSVFAESLSNETVSDTRAIFLELRSDRFDDSFNFTRLVQKNLSLLFDILY